jgi:ABC-type polysaccharide/polyol phosphate export permease
MNIKIRFKGTYLGFTWAAIEPALTFILLYIVFTSIRERTEENFAIYLLTGIVIYHVFSRGTLAGITSLTGNRGILQSININKEFFPVVTTAATCLLILVEVGVFFGLMPFFGFVPSWTIVLLPLVLAILVILILGVSYILSIIHVFVKDIQLVWGIIIHALFFITPIIWYVKDVDGILLSIHKINPIGHIVDLGHKIVVFGQVPTFSEWLYALTFAVGIFFVGYTIFYKYQERIVEEL